MASPSGSFQFLLKSMLVAAFVLWFLAVVVQPLLPAPQETGRSVPDRAAVLDYSAQAQALTGEEIAARIRAAQGRPVFLMLYASWCGVCRATMPEVAEVIRSGRMEGVETLIVSLDRRVDEMAAYLLSSGFSQDFTPYILKSTDLRPLDETLAALGLHYRSAIPYTALFDAQGGAVREFTGGLDAGQIEKTLKKAQASRR